MDSIDKVVFGDNQFFGINHMSQEKAQLLAERFFDIKHIYEVYDHAFECGIKGVMLNSNDRAKEICEHFRSHKKEYEFINWYPSIPYPHKYANMIAEKGIFPTINEVLFKGNTASGVLGMLTKGSAAILGKDAIKLMKMLVDIEMKMFKGLNVKVVFLQNIVVDLILGFEVKEVFIEYCEHVRKKYGAIPGLITQNMPHLVSKLKEWGIEEVVVCGSFNKIGYLMSPDLTTYEDFAKSNDSSKYQLMAMSTLASGAIRPKDAFEFIGSQNIQSVVFGASSYKHIKETTEILSSTL